MDFTLTVTAEDLVRGKARMNARCPLALALRRVFPHCIVSVGGLVWTAERYGQWQVVGALPEVAQEFIGEIDRDQEVQLCTFQLQMTHCYSRSRRLW